MHSGNLQSLPAIECTWLCALYAAVDAPLDADTCTALRSLLRKCASIRAGKA
jgi:survival of motor neuron protein-interacting protein 1